MIGKADELNLAVKGYRLMTRAELQKFEEQMPEASLGVCWWLADVDPDDEYYIAYAEGNYTEDDMYCDRGEPGTYIRVALDIAGVADANLKAGDEFIYCGYVFTVLDDSLAISNNFLGCAKFYESNCTLNEILGNMFN